MGSEEIGHPKARQSQVIDALLLDEPSGSRSVMKLVYALVLDALGPEACREYFRRFPLASRGRLLSEQEKLRCLWSESAPVPPDCLARVADGLESLFLGHGQRLYPALRRFAERIDILRFSPLAAVADELLRPAIDGGGVRRLLPRHMPAFVESIVPGARMHVVDTAREDRCVVVLVPGRRSSASRVDAELVAAVCQLLPALFGMSPFRGYAMHADWGGIAGKLGYANRADSGAQFSAGEGPAVVPTTLRQCLPEAERLASLVPDAGQRVDSVTAAFWCPVRARAVLHPGCAYGAPVCCFSLDCTEERDGDALSTVLTSRLGGQDLWSQLERQHQAALSPDTASTVVRYDAVRQALTIDGRHITAGVQAKILRRIFHLAVRDKRFEFDWAELASEDELICDPFSTGLSTRMNRIIQSLRASTPAVRIERYSRGKFRLLAALPIDFSES